MADPKPVSIQERCTVCADEYVRFESMDAVIGHMSLNGNHIVGRQCAAIQAQHPDLFAWIVKVVPVLAEDRD
jgi:hypothetical protein